jgi:hypothetical protein
VWGKRALPKSRTRDGGPWGFHSALEGAAKQQTVVGMDRAIRAWNISPQGGRINVDSPTLK